MSTSQSRLLRAVALTAIAAASADAQARVSKFGYPEKRAPQPTTAAITEQDLMTRVYIFADDSMQGRQVGRIGNMKGTNYIARELRRLGLQPAGDSGTYFQKVPMVQRHYTERSTITVDGATLRMNADFVPVPTGLTRAPRAIANAEVVFGGSLSDTARLIATENTAGKFLVFSPAAPGPTGGRGSNATNAPRPSNPCTPILNPALRATGGGFGGFGGGGGGGGAINLAARYPNAAAIAIVDLDQTPMGRRAFINQTQGAYSEAPPATPRAPVVVSRGGMIATIENGRVVGGQLPGGMTPAQLQASVDSARADSLARVRRRAVAAAIDTVRACATADSINVSRGGTTMLGAGGIAAADSAAIASLGGFGGGRGGGGRGGGGGGRGGAGGAAAAEAPIANIRITAAAAERLLGRPVAGLTSGTVGKTVRGALDFEIRDASDYARNVVAVIPGSDPALRGQYVLVSAHNDHVGFSTAAGPAVFNVAEHDSLKAWNDAAYRLRLTKKVGDLVSASPQELAAIRINVDSLRRIRPARPDSINNGADDDGSGSMAILEIAENIARMPVKPKRSTLFVWQTGEEGGLRGSAYFATHPTVPIDSIVANINIDMIGRGRAEDIPGGGPTYVSVIGSGFMSSDLAEAVASTNMKQKQPLALDPRFDSFTTWPGYNSIYTRSDHYNYARQCIPIAFFFTGLHGDYHQRTDEPQYLDYPHYTLITNYIRDVIVELGTRPQRPSLDKPCLR